MTILLRQTSKPRARSSGDEKRDTTVSADAYPKVPGGDIKEATPDPIPNSEVKLLGADGTARVTWWESRTLPGFSLSLRQV